MAILKIKTENRDIFNTFKFSSNSSIYKRIVVEEKGTLMDYEINDIMSSCKKMMSKDRNGNISASRVGLKNKLDKEQQVLKMIDNNKTTTTNSSSQKVDSQMMFESIKNSLENHFQNEKKIQKTIEGQIKKISVRDDELANIFLNALQKYFIDNKFEFSEEANFFDLLDIHVIDRFHLQIFLIALFKDPIFSKFIADNFKRVNIKGKLLSRDAV